MDAPSEAEADEIGKLLGVRLSGDRLEVVSPLVTEFVERTIPLVRYVVPPDSEPEDYIKTLNRSED